MDRLIFILLTVLTAANGSAGTVIVADKATLRPLPSASVFSINGTVIGMSDKKGRLPRIAPTNFPVLRTEPIVSAIRFQSLTRSSCTLLISACTGHCEPDGCAWLVLPYPFFPVPLYRFLI